MESERPKKQERPKKHIKYGSKPAPAIGPEEVLIGYLVGFKGGAFLHEKESPLLFGYDPYNRQ